MPGIRISIMKIRRPHEHLIFIMAIPIPLRRHLYFKTIDWFTCTSIHPSIQNLTDHIIIAAVYLLLTILNVFESSRPILVQHNVNGLVQDCSNFSANALELLQFCTKPSMYKTFSSLCGPSFHPSVHLYHMPGYIVFLSKPSFLVVYHSAFGEVLSSK